jgi:hypothetical protein
MKAYDAKQLVAISRYQNYFPSLPEEIREEVYVRISGLIEEEKEYCGKDDCKEDLLKQAKE